MIIRREMPDDRTAIHDAHVAAFRRGGSGIVAEARLVDELRTDGDAVLSFVAVREDRIVGHVVCSRGHVDGRPALGLGPIGVLPDHQRRGVGHALMHGVLAAADGLSEPCVVLLGDPEFYARFGFELAGPLGVLPEQPGWSEHLQIRRLTAWASGTRGTFHYAPAFGRL